jgi:probable addiction module antidote protein
MQKIKISKYDPSEDIETREDALAYLEAALEENDIEFLFKTIGHIARSKGMSKIAKELDLNCEGLSTALSPQENSSFLIVVRILDNLGFRLSVQSKTILPARPIARSS